MDEQNNALPQTPAGSTPEPPNTEIKPEVVTPTPAEPVTSPSVSPPVATDSVPVPAPAPTPTLTTAPSEAPSVSAPTVSPSLDQSASAPPVVAADSPGASLSSTTPATTESVPSLGSVETVVPAPASDAPTVNTASTSTGPVEQQPVAATPPSAVAVHEGAAHRGKLLAKLPKFSRKSFGLALMLFALLISLGSSVYFALGQRSAKNELSSLTQKITAMDANEHDLPAGAIKLSECVPNMGFHYMEQGVDPKFGPLLLVSTKGKVIGYEYMFNESMLTKIPDADIPLEVLLTNGPVLLNDWQYNSIDFSRATAGHPGFEDDHYDVHLYTVDPEEQKRACE